MRTIVQVTLIAAICLLMGSDVQAELTTAHRTEIRSMSSDLGKAASLLRRKKVDEAAKVVQGVQQRIAKIIEEAMIEPDDRALDSLNRLLNARIESIKEMGGTVGGGAASTNGSGVSFVKEVAPILLQRCNGCHGSRPSGGLQLNTFANIRKGGQSGVLLVPGSADRSLLAQRLVIQGPRRMPRNANALAQNDIDIINKWINEGAKFDGGDQGEELAKLSVKGDEGKPKVASNSPVKIAMADGTETVSFKKDIAPFMVNLCLRCHSGNNPRSGFSIETFEKLMVGGDSGRVVLPGDTDGSRMWDLVGKQQPLKMPPGQALITRSNWNNLRTWIQEGAKFDGTDPKATLRSLVPTEAELLAMELEKLTPQEFAQKRRSRSEEIWKRVSPKEEPKTIESKEFFTYGNVSQARLQEVSNWAEAHAATLRKTFGEKAPLLWKGKLGLFVAKDRFGYEEFNFTLLRRQTPQEMTGHAVVTPNYEDAYVVVQDIGDSVSDSSPGMKVNLVAAMTEAFFLRGGGDKLPPWILQGTGLALAAESNRDNAYLDKLAGSVREHLVRAAQKPESVFANGTFSPEGTKAVGFTLSQFLIKRGGEANFGRLILALNKGDSIAAAVNAIYRVDLQTMGRAYMSGVGR